MVSEELSVTLNPDEAERLTEEILDVILSLSALDFSKKVQVGYEDSGFNAVAVGLNMLGQELERSVISKQALEDEVLKRTQELTIREQKYRHIFETTSVSIWEQDISKLVSAIEDLKKSGVTDIRAFLVKHPEWMGETMSLVTMVDVNGTSVSLFGAEDKNDLMANFGKLLTEETLFNFQDVVVGLAGGLLSFDFESVARTFKGVPLNIMIQIRVPPKDAILSNALVSIVNLTSQRELEQQLRQSQKMEAIGRLAGGVAHDFNNLLTVILNYGQMLMDDLTPMDPMRKRVEAILESGERAASLTQQLLAFSRKQIIAPKLMDLNAVLVRMERMLQRLLGEDVELINHANNPVWQIKADAGQVEQIVMNLAVNARDAMPSGGKLILETHNVTLDSSHQKEHSGVEPGQYVMFAISDNGCGMTEAVSARIFEPFFTTKGLGQGTGLGLSTVYGNVKQNNGFISVYSEVGHGTTFKLYFPKVIEEGTIESPIPSEVAKPEGGKETILVVEDEERVRGVAINLLSKHGYHVLEARNGGEALLICEQEKGHIDLMLTDVIMPNMNGRQLAERLKKIKPDMKVIFMSGYTDNVIAENGVLESGSAFIQKPFSAIKLLKLIRERLDMSEDTNETIG
ncbi:MAG: response regulator [Myxococcota bacterium]